MCLSHALSAELVAMAAEDLRVRSELLADGTLFVGYHPRMAEVHHRNAVRLSAIMEDIGWPTKTVVGAEAADAAWLVLQHSIGDPPVMRRGLALLADAVARGDAKPAQLAMLEDRVRTLSGLPQRYGTQFDWDEQGTMSPKRLEDPDGVDARRAAVGLGPLRERIQEMRDAMAAEGATPPTNLERRREDIDAWERSVGWHP